MSDNIKDVDVEMDAAPTTEETTAETETKEIEENSAETTDNATDNEVKADNDAEVSVTDLTAAEENAPITEDSADDDDEDEDEEPAKKGRKKKKRLTREQRKKRRITALISTGAVVLVLAIFFISVAIANPVGVKALLKQASSFTKVDYVNAETGVNEQLVPLKDADGYWTFTTDEEFKVLQFTDVHIGGGCFSQEKDMWAMNAVATMIRAEKPDLVVVTGDIAYPVPFQAGTFNNLSATKIFANLMEALGVYWTFAFGNHDTEAYSMYTRKDICEYYEAEIAGGNFKYCLFERGAIANESNGYGNNIIKVKKPDIKNEDENSVTKGEITQAIVTFDSHSYIEGDYFGMAWKYDNIHKEQVDWYAAEMQKLQQANVDNGYENKPVKNLAFFHIPLVEYREAWAEIMEHNGDRKDNQIESTANVEYHYGVRGESDGKKNGQRTYGVFCGLHEDDLFELGFDNGLQGTFCGHDHYNNFSVSYTKDGKTIRLTYGMSVDYLAYPGIYKEHLQRGCTVIEVRPDGSFDTAPKNYYTDYDVKHEKG